MIINNVKIYTEDGTIDNGYVKIDGEHITDVQAGHYSGDEEVFDGNNQHLLPGFIDIHIHGGYGQDAMDADIEGLNILCEGLITEGTTSFLATTMTESIGKIEAALRTIASYHNTEHAEIIGIHLEGPFISEYKVGAQNPEFVIRPDEETLNRLMEASNQMIKIITIAPEVEGAAEMIKRYSDKIIYSIGHTVADYDEMNEAAENGARHITHLYNAATPFTHRAPGAFGAAWLNADYKTELISDGVHSHPAAVQIAYRLKGSDKMMLITDAMRAKGMMDGDYELGGQKVIKRGSRAMLEDGTLAGSVVKMNEGLKNFMTFTGCSLEECWRMTSLNQAQSLGIDDTIGSIAIGKIADLVLVDDEINVLTVFKKGYMKMIND